MNILNNMSVNKKMMAGFALVLLLTAGLGITAYTQVTTMNNAVNLLGTADGIEINVLEVRQQEKNYQLRERQQELDRHAEAMVHLHAHVSEAMALVTSSEDKALIAEAESAALAYESAFAELVKETQEMRAIEDECAADARAVENGIRGATYLDGAESAALLLDIQMIRRDEKNFIMRHDAEYIDDVKGAISTLQAAIDASALTASDKSAVKREIGTYQATFMEIVSTINGIDGHVDTTGPLVTHGRAIQAGATGLADGAAAAATAAAASAKTAVVAFVVIAIILGMLIAIVISRAITKPLNEVMTGANKIKDGDFGYDIRIDSKDELGDLARTFGDMKGTLQAMVDDVNMLAQAGTDGKLDVRADASKHGGDFRKIVEGVNELLDAVVGPINVTAEYVDRISKGDIPEKITDEYKGDFNEVKNNLNVCIGAINALTEEAGALAKAGAEGKLDTRADASKHGGDFQKIVDGLNELIDAVAVPVHEVVRITNAYAEGELGTRVQIDAQGEFKALGETLDQFGEDLQAIVAEAGRLAGKAADGDLTVKAEIDVKGEYNDLVNSVDALIGVLSGAVVDARGVGEKVLGTSQGLSSAAQEMNAGMEQLASSSQQVAEGSQKLAELAQGTAKNVGDVSAEIDQTSVNVGKSSEKGEEAVRISHEVQEAAQNALEGLASIQEGVARTSETVTEMNTAIERVGEMGSVITDVAGQTNMLGLNAAIEAARAGEAGRGFAVVADAVKNLAEKVKGAAGESGVAIGHIQESGENAISATSTAVEEATRGGEVLHTAVDGVDKSVGAMDEVNVMMQEINEGTQHIAEIIKTVVANMDEVASISEESASASEESSSAVEQQTSAIQELTAETQGLTETAQELMDNLSRFTVREAEAV